MNKQIRNDIKDIIAFFIDDEARHYEENDRPKDHIYLKLNRVKKWLKEVKQ